jgi:hypothetical protein
LRRASGGSEHEWNKWHSGAFVFGFVTGEPQCLFVAYGGREPVDGQVLVLVLLVLLVLLLLLLLLGS